MTVTAYVLVVVVSSAVTVALMVLEPTERFTWWPSAPVSASAGVTLTDAPSSLAVAVTVTVDTECATEAV